MYTSLFDIVYLTLIIIIIYCRIFGNIIVKNITL
nr:MAG TPA: hypothetical protein [Caudoviricetes sp.]